MKTIFGQLLAWALLLAAGAAGAASFVVPPVGGGGGSVTGAYFYAASQFSNPNATNVLIKAGAQTTNMQAFGLTNKLNQSVESNAFYAATFHYITNVAAPTAPSAVSGGAGGNSGDYYWQVTYVTANGETVHSSSSDVLEMSSEQATVTIPVSGDVHVVSRNVYRVVGDGLDVNFYFLTNIPNNSATSFTDNIPNAALVTTRPAPAVNTTANATYLNGERIGFVGIDSVYIGRNSGDSNITGTANVGIGQHTLRNARASVASVAIGDQSTMTATNASGSVGIGNGTFRYNKAVTYSVAIGQDALGAGTNGSTGNIAMGRDAGFQLQLGDFNTFLGDFAGESFWYGSNSVFLGAWSGPNLSTGRDYTNLNGVISMGFKSYPTSNQIAVIGGRDGGEVERVFIGSGVTNRSPRRVGLHATSGMGTDNAGANLELAAGQGTGSGAGGNIKLRVSAAGGSGSSHNALSDALVVSNANGSVHIPGTLYTGPLLTTGAAEFQSTTEFGGDVQQTAGAAEFLDTTVTGDLTVRDTVTIGAVNTAAGSAKLAGTNGNSGVTITVPDGVTGSPTNILKLDLSVLQVGQVLAVHSVSGQTATMTNDFRFPVRTVLGVGGANTNFSVVASPFEDVVWFDSGTTNVNFGAFMNWSSTHARRGVLIGTNRTATPRQISFGAVTNKVICLQEFDGIVGPHTATNSQAQRISWELIGTNVFYSIKPHALPNPL